MDHSGLGKRHWAKASVTAFDICRCIQTRRIDLPGRPDRHNCATESVTWRIAADLIAWLQLLALDGELALAEPKRLRYRLLHTAARLVRGQRRRRLRIPANWPWAEQIAAAFTRIAAIPSPG